MGGSVWILKNDTVEFGEFLKKALNAQKVDLMPLDFPGTATVYRLRVDDSPVVFCKRKPVDENVACALRAVPERPFFVPLFRREPLKFGGESVFLYAWREVKSVRLSEMTDGQFAQFLSGCREMYEALGEVDPTCVRPALDAEAWMRNVRGYCRRFPSVAWAFRSVSRLSPEQYLYPKGAKLSVIHGDFYTQNFGFSADGQMTFLDLETMRYGYPTEDLACVFVNGMRHASTFWNPWARRRFVARFVQAVRALPYPVGDWYFALDRTRLDKASRLVSGRRGGSRKDAFNVMRRDMPIRILRAALDRLRDGSGV